MPDDTAPAEAPDPAILRAERRLRLLEELSEIGMDLARALHRQALAAAEPVDPDPDAGETSPARPTPATSTAADPGAAFARISRAIRLTLALEARTDEALRALRAGEVAECKARRAEADRRAAAEAAARREAHGEAVERLVIEAAEREIDDCEALADVMEALVERLADDEAYQDLGRLPLRETVERLCADLELTPDWSRWKGEAWAPEAPFFRPKVSMWGQPSRRPRWPRDKTSPSHPDDPAGRAPRLE